MAKELRVNPNDGEWVVLWSNNQGVGHVETLADYKLNGPGDDYAIECFAPSYADGIEIAKRLFEERHAK